MQRHGNELYVSAIYYAFIRLVRRCLFFFICDEFYSDFSMSLFYFTHFLFSHPHISIGLKVDHANILRHPIFPYSHLREVFLFVLFLEQK